MLLRDFCSAIAPSWEINLDGVFLDLTGTGRLLGWGPTGPAQVCQRAQRNFDVRSAGAGPTLLAARLASLMTSRLKLREVFVVPCGSVLSFLAPFPIGVLEHGPRQVRRLQELGVRTLGDLHAVPRPLLRAVFGAEGDLLAAEAAGSAAISLAGGGPAEKKTEIVAGAHLARPMISIGGLAALLDCLALRAMSVCPAGPSSRCSWQLRAKLTGGRQHQVTARSREVATLAGWRGLLRQLWRRLPKTRLGLVQLELLAGSSAGDSRQGFLFPVDEKARKLAVALGRINRQGGQRVAPASGQLLSRWGIRWYGPSPNNFSSGG